MSKSHQECSLNAVLSRVDTCSGREPDSSVPGARARFASTRGKNRQAANRARPVKLKPRVHTATGRNASSTGLIDPIHAAAMMNKTRGLAGRFTARVHLTGIRRYRSRIFLLRDSVFLNEEKFSDFDDFSKTS